MTDSEAARFPDFSPPSRAQRLKEMRVLFDVARAPLSTPRLLSAPTGDGRPMFVLPGFGAGDGHPFRLDIDRDVVDTADATHGGLDRRPTVITRDLGNGIGVDGHEVTPVKRRRRMLLRTTLIDENAIAAPAIIGLSRPDTASGMAMVLYPNAQNRFWTIVR